MNKIDPRIRLDAIQIVKDYLNTMEQRELHRASGFLADGFVMTFPGGARFHKLEELVAWAKPRYRFVRKTYERFDQGRSGDGDTVTCFGTLSGVEPRHAQGDRQRFLRFLPTSHAVQFFP